MNRYLSTSQNLLLVQAQLPSIQSSRQSTASQPLIGPKSVTGVPSWFCINRPMLHLKDESTCSFVNPFMQSLMQPSASSWLGECNLNYSWIPASLLTVGFIPGPAIGMTNKKKYMKRCMGTSAQHSNEFYHTNWLMPIGAMMAMSQMNSSSWSCAWVTYLGHIWSLHWITPNLMCFF